MQVSKWGSRLAVRLPTAVVEALDLNEGDNREISIAGKKDFRFARDRSNLIGKKPMHANFLLASCYS